MRKVSVIVPIYKVEQYLRKGIDSILAQTYTDYEIILVDDGSPDTCGQICDEYAEKYDNIRVVHKENGGLSSARNAGLDVACGDYIYFFDPDDLISPVLLERCVERLEKDGSDVVKFGFLINREAIGQESREFSFADEIINIDTQEKKLDFIQNRIFNDLFWTAWSGMFRHSVIKDNGLNFADNRKIFAEDLYFTCLFIFYAQSVSLLNENLYDYLMHEDSIMGKASGLIKLNEINRLSKTLYSFTGSGYLCKNYDIIHHLIIMNEINRLPKVKKYRDVFQYDKPLDSIEDKEFFCEFMKSYHLRRGKENLKKGSFYFAWFGNMIDYYLYSRNKFGFFIKFAIWKLLYIPFSVKQFFRGAKGR